MCGDVLQTWWSFNQGQKMLKKQGREKADFVLADLNQFTKNRCVKVDKEDDKDSCGSCADDGCQ